MSDHGTGTGTSEPPPKRRKVRKGTRSCWECRRRKIRCQFNGPEDDICIGCKQRGTKCRSQEYDDDNAPEPGHRSDPPLARRLDRLEQMMERIVDRIVPDEEEIPGLTSVLHPQRSRSAASSPEPPALKRRQSSVHILGPTSPTDSPVAALLAMRHASVRSREAQAPGPGRTQAWTSAESSTTPQDAASSRVLADSDGRAPSDGAKHILLSTSLQIAMPPQSALEAIVAASPGASCIAAICHSEADRHDGRTQPASFIALVPAATQHPLVLAKRALQLLICIQQLPPAFQWDALGTGTSMVETMSRVFNAATLVTSNDTLIAHAEGLECLLLQVAYHTNYGNLRKAWMVTRRALSLAQIMGIDQGRSVAFRSCDPTNSPRYKPPAEVLWHKLLSQDRYISLILYLPIGAPDVDINDDRGREHGTPTDRLEKMHTSLSARITQRNSVHRKDPTRHQSNYALTQDIDLDLEAAAKAMPPGWWEQPRLDACARPHDAPWEDNTARMMAQIHHSTLVLLLHAPYMLRDPSSARYDFSKTTCVAAARELLGRFCTLRAQTVSTCACRRADYAGLIAAMTLCLSYLRRRRGEIWDLPTVREDVEVVALTRRRMQQVAGASGDRLSREAVNIVDKLAPIIDRAAASVDERRSSVTITGTGGRRPSEVTAQDVHFDVPYLGSITIRMPSVETAEWSAQSHGHRRHPSSATGALERMNISMSPTSPQQQQQQQPYSDVGCIQFVPRDGLTVEDVDLEPDLMADAEDWALQGVDAAFWSMFEGIA